MVVPHRFSGDRGGKPDRFRREKHARGHGNDESRMRPSSIAQHHVTSTLYTGIDDCPGLRRRLPSFDRCAGGLRDAQTDCPPTPQFSPCELVFDIPGAKTDQPIDLQALRFAHRTRPPAAARAFWDGGSRWIIRFTPAEAGTYVWQLSNGKEGQFTATPVDKPGWLRAANVHHFALVDEANQNNPTPHLWMGAMIPGFASMTLAQWKSLVDLRASQHFNHLGVTLVDESSTGDFQSPQFFRTAEEKLRYANQQGIIVDIAFFGPNGLMDRLLPSRSDRQKWFTYALSRLAAFNVTWQGIEGWETYEDGRELLKEIGDYLSSLDPYKHTRSTRANISSGPLADDGWLRYRSYQTGNDDQIGAIDQQIYQYPAVSNFAADTVDADTFRHRLWNATANGQYPSTAIPNEQAANQMKIWYEFMQGARHWELEPCFDIENGRGLALEGVEYIIYVEKPGPVKVKLEQHGYDGRWLNPITGQSVKLKEIKSEVFTGEPPDRSHDWVLQISRESHKASMLKSYRFVSREQEIQLQKVEGNPEKVPFEVVEPSSDTLSLSKSADYSVKLTRQTRALEHMMYEWMGEVTVDNRSYRIIGTGANGTLRIPANIARDYPAALHIKLLGMNALGKGLRSRPQLQTHKMMLALAVDTTADFGSIALADENGVREEVVIHAPRGFSHVLFGEIEALLARQRVRLTEIDLFAGASGPGSFTGVRVGLAAIKGLAEVFGKRVVAVSNLEALAEFGQSGARARPSSTPTEARFTPHFTTERGTRSFPKWCCLWKISAACWPGGKWSGSTRRARWPARSRASRFEKRSKGWPRIRLRSKPTTCADPTPSCYGRKSLEIRDPILTQAAYLGIYEARYAKDENHDFFPSWKNRS